MKTLLAAALLIAQSPSASASIHEDTIYLGRPVAADGQAWKSTVSLLNDNGGAWNGCTGTFIESDLLVTAAHCKVQDGGQVVFEMFKQNDPEQKVQIWLKAGEYLAYNHPRYRASTSLTPGQNDLAVIVLKDETIPEGFAPVQVFHSGVAGAADPGRTAFVAGAGRTERGEGRKRILFAQGIYSRYENPARAVVEFTNGQGICQGDSGGPIFARSGKELFLRAVTANVEANLPGHCGATLYGTVIDADRYEWIQEKATAARAQFEEEREEEREEARKAEEAKSIPPAKPASAAPATPHPSSPKP